MVSFKFYVSKNVHNSCTWINIQKPEHLQPAYRAINRILPVVLVTSPQGQLLY